MRRLAALLLPAVLACGGPGSDGADDAMSEAGSFQIPDYAGSTWYKGNTHTHTTNSDGDSPPGYVARWYKDHGYDFLVLSDHNFFTDPATLSQLVDESFLLVAGEEVTSGYEGASVHVNGLNLPGLVEARRAETLVATLQANVDAIREVEGVPHANHPNFHWSFGAEELAQIERDKLLEVHIDQDRDFKYRAVFIGSSGRVLAETESNPAVYDLQGGEGYVRAKVTDSGGWVAWTQPVFVTND